MTSMEVISSTAGIENDQEQVNPRRIHDPNASRLFWYLFGGSRGGEARLKIVTCLMKRPYNRNQLAKIVRLDYKAVQHHLGVLEKNNLIIRQGEEYGVMFFISPYLEAKSDAFEEVCNKIGKR